MIDQLGGLDIAKVSKRFILELCLDQLLKAKWALYHVLLLSLGNGGDYFRLDITLFGNEFVSFLLHLCHHLDFLQPHFLLLIIDTITLSALLASSLITPFHFLHLHPRLESVSLVKNLKCVSVKPVNQLEDVPHNFLGF